jgi:Peptidase family M28
MALSDVVTRVCAEANRAPGSDAERRVAAWLGQHLRASGRSTRLEAVWVRAEWPLSIALHAAAAVAGGVVSVWEPAIGLGVVLVVLVSLIGDLSGRWYWLRRLTPRRATQNVVSPPPAPAPAAVRLIVCANVDAGRGGAARGDPWALWEARLRRALHGHMPSALGLLTFTVLLLAGVAGARLAGASGQIVGAVQLVPTVILLIAFAALVDIALSDASPGACENASGVAVALALVRALDAAALANLEVELVLAGAGDGPALGIAAHLRGQRRERRAEDTVVLSIEACGAGTPCWLQRDGQLLPLRYHPRLVALCERIARDERHLEARALASHGCAQAHPARRIGWPAIALAARDEHGRVPRAHTTADIPELVDERAMAATLELALALVFALDADLGARRASSAEPSAV